MKPTFPACWTEEITQTRAVELAQDRIKRACKALEWDQLLLWNQTTEVGSALQFRVGLNWKSWGERITITFQPGKILIRSCCSFPFQCFDWGKNKENCLKLTQAYTDIN